MSSIAPTTKLGKLMQSQSEELSSNYCQKDPSRKSLYTPFSAYLTYGNSEDFLRNYKKTPFNKMLSIQQATIAVPIIAIMAALPPLIPFAAPLLAAAIGSLEVYKRRVNGADRQNGNQLPKAKQIFYDMLETLKLANEEFSHNPKQNKKQLEEVISTFETFWRDKSGIAPSAFKKGVGLQIPSTSTIDSSILKAINTNYLNAISLLTRSISDHSEFGNKNGLGKDISKTQTQLPSTHRETDFGR